MGAGTSSVGTFQKRDAQAAPAPPFDPTSARNGLSVDSTGHIVLGNDVGDPTNPAELLNDREIFHGAAQHNINFKWGTDSGGDDIGFSVDAGNQRLAVASDTTLFNGPTYNLQDRADGSNADINLQTAKLYLSVSGGGPVIIGAIGTTPPDMRGELIVTEQSILVFNYLRMASAGVPSFSFLDNLGNLDLYADDQTTLLQTINQSGDEVLTGSFTANNFSNIKSNRLNEYGGATATLTVKNTNSGGFGGSTLSVIAGGLVDTFDFGINNSFFDAAKAYINQRNNADIEILTNNTEAMRIRSTQIINMANVPVFASNALALAGGLVVGDLYKGATGIVSIVF